MWLRQLHTERVEDDGSGEMDVSEDGVEDDVEDSDGDEMEQTEIRGTRVHTHVRTRVLKHTPARASA